MATGVMVDMVVMVDMEAISAGARDRIHPTSQPLHQWMVPLPSQLSQLLLLAEKLPSSRFLSNISLLPYDSTIASIRLSLSLLSIIQISTMFSYDIWLILMASESVEQLFLGQRKQYSSTLTLYFSFSLLS